MTPSWQARALEAEHQRDAQRGVLRGQLGSWKLQADTWLKSHVLWHTGWATRAMELESSSGKAFIQLKILGHRLLLRGVARLCK